MGDQIKRDQFLFIYDVHLEVYNSALKDIYLNPQQHVACMQTVIPELTVYKAMLLIRDIDDKKQADIEKKKRKKLEREGMGLSEEEEEELVLDIPQPVVKAGSRKKKAVEIDPEVLEAARQVALLKKELEVYGRTWIWENYYKEDEEKKAFWYAGAAALRRINRQVLEDIQDYLMIKGFTKDGQMLQVEAIQMRTQKDLIEKRQRLGMEQSNGEQNEEEKQETPLELGVVEDQKRKFITPLRPDQRIWNFIEENEESKVPHVLRATADPNASYIDGRVADFTNLVEGMGTHLRMHQADMWHHINSMTLAIFQNAEDDMKLRMEVYEKMLEEQQQK